MAIIPLKKTVTIKRGGDTLDDWGNLLPVTTLTLNCHIEEGAKITRYLSGTGSGMSSSDTYVANARILFDKLADIRETDIIVFTNELGATFERTPKEISVKRGVNGKPLFTEVVV
jgi:hypothetical protein